MKNCCSLSSEECDGDDNVCTQDIHTYSEVNPASGHSLSLVRV